MATDLRCGNQDCNNKYLVFKNRLNEVSSYYSQSNDFVGRIKAKDYTSYARELTQIGTNYQGGNVNAMILTYDSLFIEKGWYLYSLDEEKWYFIVGITEESDNSTQQMSRRPVIKRIISIRGDL